MNWDYFGKITGSIVIALTIIALGIQQIVKKWKTNEAEVSVLDLLHSELERLGEQNKLLSEYVNKLQLEANQINLQLGKLQLENQKLHAEVMCLTMEIIKLRSALPNIKD